ncbi:MAG TPA: outer membrane beta-barrel protein [Candidatus Binatia bacterium]|jgi:opacity protein-like surface antigen
MRKNIAMLIGAAALMGTTTCAFAGAYGEKPLPEEHPTAPPPIVQQQVEEVDYAKVGPYLGIGGEYAIQQFQEIQGATGIDVSNSGGFHVRAGYRVHPNVAVEALYENFNEFDVDPNGHYDGWALTANAKGYILTGRFQPYVLAGLGYVDINGSAGSRNHPAPLLAAPAGNDFEMRFGAGMDGCITEHIAMGPEIAYVLPFGQANNLNMWTVSMGLRYKF